MTLGEWLIKKYSTEKYRLGYCENLVHHPKIDQKMIDQIGFEEILSQASLLEKEGFIQVKWKSVYTDIQMIDFMMKNMPRLCQREGMRDEREYWITCFEKLSDRHKKAKKEWLLDYYTGLLKQMKKGKIPREVEDEEFLNCLEAIAELDKDIWRRRFSVQAFKGVKEASKVFEKKYQEKVVNILNKYSTLAEDGEIEQKSKHADKDEILAEFGILTYSQSLELKGNLMYQLDEEQMVDCSAQIYGAMLNAQTLMHATPVSIEGVEQIITIENKANYEDMPYDPQILYIFVHGFPAPKVKRFLAGIQKLATPDVKVSHWGDMDLGGIRIFQYIKKHIFPELAPLFMKPNDYVEAVGDGYGILLEEDKRKQLEQLDAGMLEDLKSCILEYGLEVEQECIERKIELE